MVARNRPMSISSSYYTMMEETVDYNTSFPFLTQLNMTGQDLPAGPQFPPGGRAPVNQHYHVFRLIETYFVPFICSLGLVCNTLAVLTFLRKDLKKHSCSLYLMTRSISDSLFLLNLAVIYISHSFDFEINRVRGICQIMNFVAYVSAFISVWSVILVTVENYIRIIHPFRTKGICTPRTAKICILILVMLALCVYHVPIWIANETCAPSAKFIAITQVFIYTDTVLTLVVPTILLTFLVIAIMAKIIQTHEKRDKLCSAKGANTRLVTKPKRKLSTSAKMAVVTKLLLAVSLTFFILTVPSHIIRIKILISAFVRGYTLTSDTEAAVQGIAQLIYYTSMSVNLFIYLIFGDNFRRVFRIVFCKTPEAAYVGSNSDKENRHATPLVQNSVKYENVSDSAKTSSV